MGREEYLERLRRALAGRMAAEEVERTVAYYAACLDEAGPEGEEARMANWGTPEELGARLLDDLGRKTLSPRGRKLLWGAIAGVLVLSAALWLVRLQPWAAPKGDRGSSDLTEPFTAVDVDLDSRCGRRGTSAAVRPTGPAQTIPSTPGWRRACSGWRAASGAGCTWTGATITRPR